LLALLVQEGFSPTPQLITIKKTPYGEISKYYAIDRNSLIENNNP